MRNEQVRAERSREEEGGAWSREDGAGKVFLLKVGVGRVGESDKWEKSRGEFCYNLVGGCFLVESLNEEVFGFGIWE